MDLTIVTELTAALPDWSHVHSMGLGTGFPILIGGLVVCRLSAAAERQGWNEARMGWS